MLSIPDIRRILGEEISDKEAESLRDACYGFAEMALDAFLASYKRCKGEGDFGSPTKEKRFRKQARQTPVPPKEA